MDHPLPDALHIRPNPDDPALTLIVRARGRWFLALLGAERIVFDGAPKGVPDGRAQQQRKGAEG